MFYAWITITALMPNLKVRASYFKIPVKEIVPERPRRFPIYLYLELNNDVILRYSEDQKLNAEELAKYTLNGVENFFCPNEYSDQWDAYRNPPTQTLLAELADEASEIIGRLSQHTEPSSSEVMQTLQKCKNFNGKVLRASIIQRQGLRVIYSDMMALQRTDGEHSSLVSAFSVIFCLAINASANTPIDATYLFDISFGALLHDIGLLKFSPALLKKPQNTYADEDIEEMNEHVFQGMEILRRSKVPMSSVVTTIVEQHHENYDGSGYPKRLHGDEISEAAQIVAFSDTFVDLMTGHIDGRCRSPKEALDWMTTLQGRNRALCRFKPELYLKLIHFIDSAQAKRQDLDEKAEDHLKLSA